MSDEFPVLVKYEFNPSGRDWVVGDIHGHFSKLEDNLAAKGFDPAIDRLFVVGDLVDRGPESERVLEFLDKPWFFSILGNHEEMCFLYFTEQWPESNYLANGGTWFVDLPKARQFEIATQFMKLPFAIQVGDVGIIHANTWEPDWENLENSLSHPNEQLRIANRNELTWGRDRIRSGISAPVRNIRAIFCGHTPVKHRHMLDNFHFIDTGAWAKDTPFKFFDLKTLEEV